MQKLTGGGGVGGGTVDIGEVHEGPSVAFD
jgi:hypothetical protein